MKDLLSIYSFLIEIHSRIFMSNVFEREIYADTMKALQPIILSAICGCHSEDLDIKPFRGTARRVYFVQ